MLKDSWNTCLTPEPSPLGTFGPGLLRVTHVLKRITPGSSGYLVRCDNNKLYVLQLGGQMERPNNTTNEAFGSYFMARLGFLIPNFRVALINATTASMSKECDHVLSYRSTETSIVTHFASEFLHEPDHQLFSKESPVPHKQIYNYQQFLGTFVFDVFAGKVDRRRCLYKQNLKSGRVSAFFIGNGNLFGGPAWADLGSRPAVVCTSGCPRPVAGGADLGAWISYIQKNVPIILRDVENFPSYHLEGPPIGRLKDCLLKRGEQLHELVRKEIALQELLEHREEGTAMRTIAVLR